MHRRKWLVTVGSLSLASVAGCSGGSGGGSDSGGSDSSEGNNEATNTEESLAPPTLESHDIQPMTGGYDMTVTMTNETEVVLDRAVGEVAVYDGDTRLTDGRAAVVDLEPGVTSTETALLEEIRPDDVTRYTITMSGQTQEYEETESEQFEFDGEEFRSRLSE